MATDVADINVVLTAQAKQYKAELDRATKKLDRFVQRQERGLNKSQQMWKKFGAAIASAGIVRSMQQMVTSFANSANRLADMSDRIGIAVEDLSRLQHAAELTGVSTQTLELGLQRMTRRIGEASLGTGEAKKALDAFGLSAKEMAELDSASQLKVLADAFEGVENEAQKLALAVKIFDTEAAGMLVTMKGGSKALEEMMGQSDELGRTISEETAAAAREFNAQLIVMKAQLAGVANEIMKRVVPALSAALQKWREWLDRPESLQNVLDLKKQLERTQWSINNQLEAGKSVSMELYSQEQKLLEDLSRAQRIYRDERNKTFGNLPGPDDVAVKPDFSQLNLGALGGSAGGTKPAALPSPLEDAYGMNAAGDQMKSALDQYREFNKEAVFIAKEAEDEKTRLLTQANEDRLGATSMYFGALATMSSASNDRLASISRAAALVQTTISAAVAGMKAWEAGGPYAGPALAAAVAGVAASFISTIEGARAMGGPVRGGSTYLVGERGPELFTPNASGNITPNNQLGGINVNLVEDASRAGQVREVSAETIEIAVAVIDSKMRSDLRTGRGIWGEAQAQYGLSRAGIRR